MLALTGFHPQIQDTDHRLAGRVCGDLATHQVTNKNWPPKALARIHAGKCLDDRIMGRSTTQPTLRPETGYHHIDLSRVEHAQLLATQIQLVHHARANVMNDDTYIRDQAADQLLASRIL